MTDIEVEVAEVNTQGFLTSEYGLENKILNIQNLEDKSEINNKSVSKEEIYITDEEKYTMDNCTHSEVVLNYVTSIKPHMFVFKENFLIKLISEDVIESVNVNGDSVSMNNISNSLSFVLSPTFNIIELDRQVENMLNQWDSVKGDSEVLIYYKEWLQTFKNNFKGVKAYTILKLNLQNKNRTEEYRVSYDLISIYKAIHEDVLELPAIKANISKSIIS